MRGNALITLGVLSEVAILAVINYVPWANAILGTAPMVGAAWGFIVPFAAAMFALEELRKWAVRTRAARFAGGR
jgi:hypothetical protein